MDIRYAILVARKKARLTQQEAADAAGVSASTWRGWEAGRSVPRADALLRAAEALGVSPNDLFGWADRPGGSRSPVGGVTNGDR